MFLTAVTYKGTDMGFLDVMLAEALTLACLICECAFALFVSSRVDRPFTALGVVIGSLAFGLAIVPSLLSVMLQGASMDWPMFLHPYFVIAKIMEAGQSWSNREVPYELYGWPQTFFYLAMTAVFLVWTVRTLRYADGEAQSAPKVRNDA
jgi:ABC-type transport system involved in multi-copper enzyme maturation permease subunit